MSDPALPTRPIATALRYLAIIVACACLLLAAFCLAVAAQVFVQTGAFAQSYAMVGFISAALGLLALMLARMWN
ncbi:hypothetical protein [Bradyrhizobium stylosanthis]|uniref:Uncharacterized protein n=1 Tax=Bradyrhizobium stylosanthis TaxID=1803665 RepID=A0A560E455_9BRAD|nr:hypothetical protein [Bradyrhizobium stylosanthis]TWB04172.1 hypothetical protein FBZ96_102647 [Bradyrhizobium stylosanthis]